MYYYLLLFLLGVSFFILYFEEKEHYYKEIKKELLFVIATIILIVTIYPLKSIDEFIFHGLMVTSVLSIVIIYFKVKEGIIAKQVSFWDIPVPLILSVFKKNIIKKKGRNELIEQEDEYFFDIQEKNSKVGVVLEKKISPIIYSNIKNYKNEDFTFVNKLEEIEKISVIYSKIFTKIKNVAILNEKNINYEEILNNCYKCAEFFLLYCWEEICYNEIIGTGTLNTIAVDQKDLSLIYAIDAVKMSNISKDGLMLYAHYLKFKDFKVKGVNSGTDKN